MERAATNDAAGGATPTASMIESRETQIEASVTPAAPAREMGLLAAGLPIAPPAGTRWTAAELITELLETSERSGDMLKGDLVLSRRARGIDLEASRMAARACEEQGIDRVRVALIGMMLAAIRILPRPTVNEDDDVQEVEWTYTLDVARRTLEAVRNELLGVGHVGWPFLEMEHSVLNELLERRAGLRGFTAAWDSLYTLQIVMPKPVLVRVRNGSFIDDEDEPGSFVQSVRFMAAQLIRDTVQDMPTEREGIDAARKLLGVLETELRTLNPNVRAELAAMGEDPDAVALDLASSAAATRTRAADRVREALSRVRSEAARGCAGMSAGGALRGADRPGRARPRARARAGA